METQKPTGNKIRGLGCGGPKKVGTSGKLTKVCLDCGKKFQVASDKMFCPECEGPLQ